MKVRTALILCAGLGKRLNPITLKKPKPLLEWNGKSLIEFHIDILNSLNIKPTIVLGVFLNDLARSMMVDEGRGFGAVPNASFRASETV